jgi:hypothetical protein
MASAVNDLMCAEAPTTHPARRNNIPQELRNKTIWLRYKLEKREGKTTKVPYRSDGMGMAKTNDASTWSDFATAVDAKVGNGVGCVVKDGMVVIDLDKVRDTETGVIEPWAQTIIDECQSYTEISPSKRGVHIWLRGEVPVGGNRKGRMEMYDRNSPRYMTVTGDVLINRPIREHDLSDLHKRMLNGADPLQKVAAQQEGVDDSKADYAFCRHLAEQGNTAEEIDAAVRASSLMRPKWDERRGSDTYGERTIASALAGMKAVAKHFTRVKITKGNEMEKKIVNWLWKNRIVSGALNLFSGEPGSGKGTVCAYIAARISTGTDWWDGKNTNPPSKVLMVSSEEEIESMVLPKLDVAGANLENIGFLSCEEVTGTDVAERDFCVEKNLKMLDQHLQENPDTRLIILDPVINHLSSVDVNKDQEIRKVLTPLKVVVEKHNVAVIMVNHFNKGTGLGLNRVGMCKGFSAATRAAWGFTKDETTGEVLIQDIRVSNAKEGNNFKFKMRSVPFTADDGQTDETPLAEFTGKSDKLFNDTLELTSNPEVRKGAKAKVWLLQYLNDGKQHVTDVIIEMAAKVGLEYMTLYRAYNQLEGHIKPIKTKETNWKWVWQLHGTVMTSQVVEADDMAL